MLRYRESSVCRQTVLQSESKGHMASSRRLFNRFAIAVGVVGIGSCVGRIIWNDRKDFCRVLFHLYTLILIDIVAEPVEHRFVLSVFRTDIRRCHVYIMKRGCWSLTKSFTC